MPTNELNHNWNMRIRQLPPNERKACIYNLTWQIVGIHQIRQENLSRIAGKIPSTAKWLSVIQLKQDDVVDRYRDAIENITKFIWDFMNCVGHRKESATEYDALLAVIYTCLTI